MGLGTFVLDLVIADRRQETASGLLGRTRPNRMADLCWRNAGGRPRAPLVGLGAELRVCLGRSASWRRRVSLVPGFRGRGQTTCSSEWTRRRLLAARGAGRKRLRHSV